jgi:hypothetical protein
LGSDAGIPNRGKRKEPTDEGDRLGEAGEGDYILINKKVIVTYSQKSLVP